MYRFEVEDEAPAAPVAAPSASSPPATATVPPERQARDPDRAGPVRPASSACCSIPRTRKDKAKDAAQEALARRRAAKIGEGWQPSTSASPVHAGRTDAMRLFPFRLQQARSRHPAARRRQRRPRRRQRPRRRRRRADEDDVPTAADGWLTAVNVQKSYRSRMVVKGVSLATGRGEAVGPAGPQRRRQDHRVLHDHRPGAGRRRPASPSTAAT